ncbi:hypothetical protein DB346_20865 [Verrucomicrobia bacterium LW23]|nr:hypothetical protein DB346_20865 [Verrucomicrobia bacterium LW23]
MNFQPAAFARTTLSCIAAALLLSNSTAIAKAEDFDIDMLSESDIKVGVGKSSDGSVISLSSDKPRTGKQALKLIYNILPGNGYAEFVFNQRRLSPRLNAAGKWKIAMWVRGDSAIKAGPVGLRFLDGRGEVFQFMLPKMEEALRSSDWTKYEVTLDLDVSQGHWGNNSDGIADAPLSLFSLAVNGGPDGDAGTIYVDDISFEPDTGK